jgi:hypothetical protein
MKGGGYTNYPLHHIMMGKGKSTVLTPLLSLYFSLIQKKKYADLLQQGSKAFFLFEFIFVPIKDTWLGKAELN